jgi:hypothetical protein
MTRFGFRWADDISVKFQISRQKCDCPKAMHAEPSCQVAIQNTYQVDFSGRCPFAQHLHAQTAIGTN